MFTIVSLAIAKMWEDLKCPFTDEWIKKIWDIHIGKYYSTFFKKRKKKILQPVTTWMKLKGIMLSKIRQTLKDKYCMIPFTYMSYLT